MQHNNFERDYENLKKNKTKQNKNGKINAQWNLSVVEV